MKEQDWSVLEGCLARMKEKVGKIVGSEGTASAQQWRLKDPGLEKWSWQGAKTGPLYPASRTLPSPIWGRESPTKMVGRLSQMVGDSLGVRLGKASGGGDWVLKHE